MLFLRFDRGLYAYVFAGVVLFVAGFAVYDNPGLVTMAWFTGVTGSFAFCMAMCRDEGHGYRAGLENLGRRHAGGVVNFAVIILVPIFCVLHILCRLASL